jgi:hypothetical protein
VVELFGLEGLCRRQDKPRKIPGGKSRTSLQSHPEATQQRAGISQPGLLFAAPYFPDEE